MGRFQGNEEKISYLEAFPPPGFSRWTAQHHGAGDEFRWALGRVASFALVGWKIAFRPTPAGSIDIVMLIGSSIRQEV
jgi:hypothetical protein